MLNENANDIEQGSIFTLGSYCEYRLIDIIQAVEKIFGGELNINWDKDKKFRNTTAFPPNASVVPGWKPVYSLQNGLKKIFNDT